MKTLMTPRLIAYFIAFITLAGGFCNAADCRLQVLISGRPDFVLVIPGSNTGGRVLTAANGVQFTDRVQRGETIRFTLTPQDGWEVYYPAFAANIVSPGVQSYSLPQPGWDGYLLPTTATMRVPMNPIHDNLSLRVYTPFYERYFRIPIGSR